MIHPVLKLTLLIFLILCLKGSYSQKNISPFADSQGQLFYSDFDAWNYRIVKEQGIIGGAEKTLHVIGEKGGKSPWCNTNLYAKVGVDIGQVSVFPEKRAEGYCVKMTTDIRKLSVIGINFNTLLTGSIFLGSLDEPFRSVNNPQRKFDSGIPFSGKPKAIQFDFKYNAGQKRVNAVYIIKPASGVDKAEFCLLLQRRWEDEAGNIKAIRIGGARNYLRDTKGEWVNDSTITVQYGDITGKSFYNPKTMDLIPKVSEMYARNSKGKMVPVVETEWDTKNLEPTHIVIFFTSSYDGINYNGSTESTLWIDNVKLVY